MMDTVQDIAAELSADGDECEVGAWTLRLTVEPDEYADPVADMGPGSWYGRVELAEWVNYGVRVDRDGYTYHHWEGHYARPAWADGAAELVHLRDGAVWWRPETDVVRDPELRRKMRWALRELLEYGYSVVVVEAFRHRDLYGRGCVEAVASIGSVEPGDDIADVVGDVVAEVLAQVQEVDQ